MHKIITLVFLIFTTTYTNKTVCMLSKEMKQSNKQKYADLQKEKGEKPTLMNQRPLDNPLALRGILKGHGNWITRIAELDNQEKK